MLDDFTANNGLNSLGLDSTAQITVLGLGVTGLSVVRYLIQQGLLPQVVDSRDNPPGLTALASDFPQVRVTIGQHAFDALDQATHLIVSPGVALKEHGIQAAIRAGVAILSDIDLFAVAVSAPVIAITGSNGKTTVTTLVGLMLEKAGLTVGVGGNIGTAALTLLEQPAADCYVLELSSFQLEATSHLKPAAATVLNISADHMDRYATLADYAAAKASIFDQSNVCITQYQSAEGSKASDIRTDQRYFGVSDDMKCDYRLAIKEQQEWLIAGDRALLPASDVKMQGRHNLENALAAVALVDCMQINLDAAIEVLREFSGLPHRMQLVSERNGVLWINDSKATNIGATVAALSGFEKSVILIAGGDGKGADFNELREVVSHHVSTLLLIGRDAILIEQALAGCCVMEQVQTLEQAVARAAVLANVSDTVLLSPACASLDQFANYQLRGEAFVDAISRLPV